MEKFKACEKEMKTKAFSKEGLTQSAKLDPKQQEKVDTMSWVQQMMDELMVQVETAEKAFARYLSRYHHILAPLLTTHSGYFITLRQSHGFYFTPQHCFSHICQRTEST